MYRIFSASNQDAVYRALNALESEVDILSTDFSVGSSQFGNTYAVLVRYEDKAVHDIQDTVPPPRRPLDDPTTY